MQVSHLVQQIDILKKLQRIRPSISYPKAADNELYCLTFRAFTNAIQGPKCVQLEVIVGLLVGDMKLAALYQAISSMTHMSKRPVKSVPAAKTLAALEGIDESDIIAHGYQQLLRVFINVRVFVGSRDLFTSLSIQRNSIDRSIRSDFAYVQCEFQVRSVDMITWVPGKPNLADVLTMPDILLTEALQLKL